MERGVDSLIGDLEATLAGGSSDRRLELLKKVTSLFMERAGMATAMEVDVFDTVLVRLVDGIEARARAELAARVAAAPEVPGRVARMLARDTSSVVAGPLLETAECFDEGTLVDFAETLGQGHLLAISRRRTLGTKVTDILVTRGDQEVVRSVAGNDGARFSGTGFDVLVSRAVGDDVLAEAVGRRSDLPPETLRDIVAQASETVRQRLAARDPARALEIAQIVAEIAKRAAPPPRDFTRARAVVAKRRAAGMLDDDAVLAFASSGRVEETLAALALMNDLPCELVDQTFAAASADPILILGRAASLAWPTVETLLVLQNEGVAPAPGTLAEHRANYATLKATTAQRVVRFYKVRYVTSGGRDVPRTGHVGDA